MVNTFLPWPGYDTTAKALDNRRLGKQRVEALQILKANLGMTQGWRNHPAAVMWRGHEGDLCRYARAMCEEWKARGFNDTVSAQIDEIEKDLPPESFRRPWWSGNNLFHQSHQSNLVRKDPTHYTFPVIDDLPYLWPKQEIGKLQTKEQAHEEKRLLLQHSKESRKKRILVSESRDDGARPTSEATDQRIRVVKRSTSKKVGRISRKPKSPKLGRS
jgi:hypothetical protein